MQTNVISFLRAVSKVDVGSEGGAAIFKVVPNFEKLILSIVSIDIWVSSKIS